MTLRCPRCASREVTSLVEQAEMLGCDNCGTTFQRGEALVGLADADARAEKQRACTCNDVRGCPQCFERADEMVGAIVRDDQGREWEVTEADEKNGFPTVGGAEHWACLDDVTAVRRAGRTYTAAAFPLYADRKTGDQLASTSARTIAGALEDLGALLESCQIEPEAEALDVTLSWTSS